MPASNATLVGLVFVADGVPRVVHITLLERLDGRTASVQRPLSGSCSGGTMVVDERARHELQARLEQVLGTNEATTLMGYLPPVGWADVATKRDLDHLADRLRVEFHRELHNEVGSLRTEISAQGRNLFFGVLASNATLVGLVFAAVKLA